MGQAGGRRCVGKGNDRNNRSCSVSMQAQAASASSRHVLGNLHVYFENTRCVTFLPAPHSIFFCKPRESDTCLCSFEDLFFLLLRLPYKNEIQWYYSCTLLLHIHQLDIYIYTDRTDNFTIIFFGFLWDLMDIAKIGDSE